MSQSFPYYYRAYGLNIASEIPVTGFQSVGPIMQPDVIIKEGKVPGRLDTVINEGVLFQSNSREYLLKIDTVASYYVKDGSEITVSGNPDCSIHEVSAFLIGSTFGALLHQRRMLPLHASTVVYNKKCLVFMGLSGAGKTTLAAALIREGAMLVADDISVFDFTGEKPAVIPAFPAIKIWKDSLKHMEIGKENLFRVREELEKYYLPVDRFADSPQPVDAVFLLVPHNKEEIEFKQIEGIDKFQVAKRHTYLFRGIPKTGLEINHFELVSKLIQKVPLYKLSRPNSGFNTAGLISVLNDHLFQHD